MSGLLEDLLVILKPLDFFFEDGVLKNSAGIRIECFNSEENTVLITKTPDNGKKASTWGRKRGLDRVRAVKILKQILLEPN
jgi:hypothetical protein